VAASLGLEPRQRDPESLVLPLHHEARSEKVKDAWPQRKCGPYDPCYTPFSEISVPSRAASTSTSLWRSRAISRAVSTIESIIASS
jgi:hypothetical protein